MHITRRSFVKGMGIVAMGIAGTHLIACTPKSEQAGVEDAPSYDIVIVGGGGSGLSAAIAAREAGKSVLVLEQMDRTGGAYQFVQSTIFVPRDSSEIGLDAKGLADYWLEMTDYKANEALIRNVTSRAADTLDQVEGYGVQTYTHIAYVYMGEGPEKPFIRDYAPTEQFATSSAVVLTDKLLEVAKELGVEIMTSTTVMSLLVDEKGAVAGVVAQADGQETTYVAKKVIIATGGFGAGTGKDGEGNDVVDAFAPQLMSPSLRCSDFIGSDGSGIMMAIDLGADASFEGTCARGTLRTAVNDGNATPGYLLVDDQGKRFINEGADSYVLYYDTLEHPSDAFFEIMDSTATYQGIDDAVSKGNAYKADTIEDLAAAMGVDAAALSATVSAYNASAEKGVDEEFGKPASLLKPIAVPPFYAGVAYLRIGGTIGGLMLDGDARILDKNGNPIPNLYGCGDCANNNLHYIEYLGGGTGSCWALNTGKIAAETAIADMAE